jgi:hypothetical protein
MVKAGLFGAARGSDERSLPKSGRPGHRPIGSPLMTDDATGSPPDQDSARLTDRREDLVWWATWVALLSALVGLVDGLMTAMKKKVATCPDGTIFAEGQTDFDCYVHPQAGLGVAIAALAVVLAILVVFASMVVRTSLGARPLSP